MRTRLPLFPLFSIFLTAFFLVPDNAAAQIRINFPAERAVYQRGSSGYGTITVSGSYSKVIDKVEVKAVPVYPGQGIPKEWAPLTTQPAGGVFTGTVELFGGWYTLLVRGTLNGAVVEQEVSVPRVGVGEVFIIGGQSNAQGLRGTYVGPGAKDDRVNYISNNENTQNSLLDPNPPTFSHLDKSDIPLNPRGQGAWCWGALGDKLVQKLNVPVLFINVAWDGTGIKNWAESSRGVPTQNHYSGFLYPDGMPYANLVISARHYANTLGIRSILWMQGETDTYPARTSRAQYRDHLQSLINKFGSDISKRIIWTIALTSRTSVDYTPGTSMTGPEIIAAQNDVLNTPFNPVYRGPETDNLAVPRKDGIHFATPEAIETLANAWNDIMNIQYFSNITPVTPATPPSVSVACASNNNSLTLTLPQGYASYRWSTGATGRVLTVTSPGSYSATVKDNNGNALTTGTVFVASVKPQLPSILPSGDQQACGDGSFEFRVAGSDAYTWYKDGQDTPAGSGATLKAETSGSYTVKARNIFGCVSDMSAGSKLTVHPALGKARLSAAGPFSLMATVGDNLPATYEWYRNNKLLSGVTDQIYRVSDFEAESASYTVKAKAIFTLPGTTNKITCLSEMSDAVTYENNADENVVAFPNPGRSSDIQIESREKLRDVEVVLYDIQGRQLFTRTFPELSKREKINPDPLPRGVYLLQIRTSGLNETKRVILY